jgi:hypothetical protein
MALTTEAPPSAPPLEHYPRSLIWAWLRAYRGAATIVPGRDDRLSTTRPLNAAGVQETFERSSVVNADMERALRSCSPWEICITVQAVSLMRGEKWGHWRRVGEPWGLSAGDVDRLTEDIVRRMYSFLNRAAAPPLY